MKFCFYCVVYETSYQSVLERSPAVQPFVPAHSHQVCLATTIRGTAIAEN